LASCAQNYDCKLVDLKRLCPVVESINIHNSTTEIENFITEEQTLIGSGRMLVKCVTPKKINAYYPVCVQNICDMEKN
jgi:archaellum biogenesis ATPase FlaH